MFKPDLTAPPWLKHAEAARARFTRVTPFRLGYFVGLAGDRLMCPYTLPLSMHSYQSGVNVGRAAAASKPTETTP